MKEITTVNHRGNYEVIGPVNLPLKLSDTTVATFTIFYFEFPTGRYNIITKGHLVDSKEVLVRVQSKCIWGIEFGSQYCDCQWQLEESKRLIDNEGLGIIIYCHDHNGKGIGLKNHCLVYAEGQKRNLELVVDAYEDLGFREDYRRYDDVVNILRHFGIRSIRLLSNNPKKISEIQNMGVNVRRLPLESPLNKFLEEEYHVKKIKLGHLLSLGRIEKGIKSENK